MTARTIIAGLAEGVASSTRWPLAALGAVLPSRYWLAMFRLPIREMLVPSAIATGLAGLVVGGRGFMAYAVRAGDAAAQLTLDGAARQATGTAPGSEPITTLAPQLVSVASVVAFTLFTPAGLLAAYLVVSAVLRIASVVADDAVGDPLLTALDWSARSAAERWHVSAAEKRRATAEGPETADRLFTGEGAGLVGVDYVVVASRRKPGWNAGTIVVTPDGWFRLSKPFDAQMPYGLRTVYPLTCLGAPEVLRRAVEYELPPLQRGPGRIERR